MKNLSKGAVMLGLWLAACGGMLGKPTVGGESHFLQRCSEGCGELDCVADLCTRICLVDESSCSDLAPRATCTNASVEPGAVAVCDLTCGGDADCAGLGAAFGCSGGFCRPVASAIGRESDSGSGGSSGTVDVAGGPAEGGSPATPRACALDPGTTTELGVSVTACAAREQVACIPQGAQTAEDLVTDQLSALVRGCADGWEGQLTVALADGCATAVSGHVESVIAEEQVVVDCLVGALGSRRYACADGVKCVDVSSHFGIK